MIYLWVKVLHVLAVISWMAGLFYLPRLFVYHADRPVAGEGDEIFKIMERRLLKAIMRPAAVVVALTGSVLLYVLALPLVEPWVALKLLAVILMFGFH
ncbi:MAG: TIGR00701 family protein, partial [Phyllobacteriaceae bacterium]|nr:TIGR00701 family protein [Phyllobacteriaceae bacterium]